MGLWLIYSPLYLLLVAGFFKDSSLIESFSQIFHIVTMSICMIFGFIWFVTITKIYTCLLKNTVIYQNKSLIILIVGIICILGFMVTLPVSFPFYIGIPACIISAHWAILLYNANKSNQLDAQKARASVWGVIHLMKEHIKLPIIVVTYTLIAILCMSFIYSFTGSYVVSFISFLEVKTRFFLDAAFLIEYMFVSLFMSAPLAYIVCKYISLKPKLLIILTLVYCLAAHVIWFSLPFGDFDVLWAIQHRLVQVFLVALLISMLFIFYKVKVYNKAV